MSYYWIKRLLYRLNRQSRRLLPSIHICPICNHHVQANHNHFFFTFGRRFPDKRARLLMAEVPSIQLRLKPVKLPAEWDWRNVNGKDYTDPVDDQGQEGACTGFGAKFKGCMERISGTFQEVISTRFIYNLARYLGGYLGQEGANMIDIMNGLLQYGVCRAHYWPYVAEGADKDDWPPKDPDALVDAKNWRIKSFWDCMKDADGSPAKDPVGNVKQAVYQLGEVDTGTPWTDSWMNAWYVGNMPVPSDNDPLDGGHSWRIYGFSDSRGLFLCRNSWGKTNAMGGDFTVPYATLTCKNWQGYGGCEIYKAEDGPSVDCPDGQHYNTDTQQCEDDGASPNPPDCQQNFLTCVNSANGDWTLIISCLINYFVCAFNLQTPPTMQVSKSKKTITVVFKKPPQGKRRR